MESNPVDDRLLEHLRGQRKLKTLDIMQAKKVTDDGLANLRHLGRLEDLSITGASNISDDGLAHLVTNQSLRLLMISESKTSHAGFQSLGNLKALKTLDIDGFFPDSKLELEDADLAAIKNLTDLESLSLGPSIIGDKGVASLQGMKKLWSLTLPRSQLSDRGLETLAHHLSLKQLVIPDSPRLTDAGIAKLKAARPDMTVISGYDENGNPK